MRPLAHMFLSSSRQTLDFWGFRVADPLSLCLINDYKGAKAIRKLDISIWADTAGQIPTSILVYGQYKTRFVSRL